MTVLESCERCGHPADWHRHDDTSLANTGGHNSHGVISGESEWNPCPYRCVRFDCLVAGVRPDDGQCTCPDFVGTSRAMAGGAG